MFNFTHRCQIGQRQAVRLYDYNGKYIRLRWFELGQKTGADSHGFCAQLLGIQPALIWRREDCIS